MLLRNAWYIAAWADEIGGEPLARRICDEPIVLFRDGGRAAALADRCCHRAAPLHMGAVVEEGIQCGYHGLIFDGAGRCVHIPGQKQIPADAPVRGYPVVEKDQLVWVWTGDPAKADTARDRRLSLSQRSRQMAEQARRLPDQRQLHADGRQSDGLDPSGLPARQDGGRQPAAHVEAEMKTTRTPDRAQIHPLAAELGAAAELCQGRRLYRAGRPLAGIRVRRTVQRLAMDRGGRCRHRRRRRQARRRVPVPPVPRPDPGDRDQLLLFLVGGERLSPERPGGDRTALPRDRPDFCRRPRHGRGAAGRLSIGERIRRGRPRCVRIDIASGARHACTCGAWSSG